VEARSEAERAAPGNVHNKDQALKGRQNASPNIPFVKSECTDQPAPEARQKVLSTAVLGVVLSPFQGSVSWRQVIQGQRVARSPLDTFCRTSGGG